MKALVLSLHDKEQLDKIPRSLPVFFIYGNEDPVGEYGKAVQKVYASYQEMGMENVSEKEYKGLRHELLNEKEAPQIMNDVYQWIEQNIK